MMGIPLRTHGLQEQQRQASPRQLEDTGVGPMPTGEPGTEGFLGRRTSSQA